MNTYDILAIVGAFAWLPFIINFVRDMIKKPKLTIIPDNQIEIGFNTLGPIFNINLAFLSDNKSALINDIKLELVHESNEITNFTWTWYEESLFQMDIPKVPIAYKKNQKAIALNVNENILVEKKIGFQSIKFKEDVDRLVKMINEDSANLRNSGKNLTELKALASYNNIIDFSQSSFIWKQGVYKAKFTVYLKKDHSVFSHDLKFQLSNFEIKTLHKNIESCKAFLDKVFIDVTEELIEKWEWITVKTLSETESIRISYQKS